MDGCVGRFGYEMHDLNRTPCINLSRYDLCRQYCAVAYGSLLVVAGFLP